MPQASLAGPKKAATPVLSYPLVVQHSRHRFSLLLCFPPSTQVITLERYLPYTIQSGINSVVFRQAKGAVRDSGVEGVTFQFAWQLYAGHHLVRAKLGAPGACWAAQWVAL